MQNTQAKRITIKEAYEKSKTPNYIRCAICHHDFKSELQGTRVCDRCWSDYEDYPVLINKKRTH